MWQCARQPIAPVATRPKGIVDSAVGLWKLYDNRAPVGAFTLGRRLPPSGVGQSPQMLYRVKPSLENGKFGDHFPTPSLTKVLLFAVHSHSNH